MNTVAQTDKPYYAEATYEDQLVWACLTSPDCYSRVGRLLNPAMLSQPHSKLLMQAAAIVYKATKRGPSNPSIALQRLTSLRNDGKLSEADLSAAKAWVDEYEASKPVINVDAVVAEIAPELSRRMKHEAARSMFDRIGKNGDTKKVVELLQAADKVGKADAERLQFKKLSPEDADKDPVDWIWKGRIARGTFHLLFADEGMGKSTLLRDIAVRMMMGNAMPDADEGGAPENVLLVGPEDNESFIANRFVGAGLDAAGFERFLVSADSLRLPSDVDKLREVIVSHQAALVIIEQHGLDKGSDSIADDVRRGVDPLSQLAKETGAAILIVRHTTKLQTGNARQTSNGSHAWQAAARHVLRYAPAPDNADARVLAVSKTNLGPKAAAIGASEEAAILPNGLASMRLVWDDTIENISADDLVAAQHARQQSSSPKGNARDTQYDTFRATVQTFLRDGAVKTKDEITAVLETVGLGNPSKLKNWLPKVAETFKTKNGWFWRLIDAPTALPIAA